MKILSAVIFAVLALSACALRFPAHIVESSPASIEQTTEKDTFVAQIGIVNHTGHYIHSAIVNARGAGHKDKFGAGNANMCCVTLPLKWHPGLEVDVAWNMPEGRTDVWKRRSVDVEKYDSSGDIYLHFFQNDQVRVVVSEWVGWSLNHPIAPPSNPHDAPDQKH